MNGTLFGRRCLPRLLLAALLAAPAVAVADRSVSTAERPESIERLREVERTVLGVVRKTTPAVVFIGGGSGVCISPEGEILTNDHVVGNRDVVLVRFAHTGLRRRAKLLGRFPDGDLSLLRIEEEGTYPHLELGDSDALAPGERVIALGNPFLLATDNAFFQGAPPDYDPSVSLGVVSALHRNSPPRYPDAIQVDVAVNPGNSGGPLVDMDGALVGINGKIETRFHVSVNSGVGYAIPSRQIARFLGPLRKADGKVIGHGKILGVEVGDRVLEDGPGLPVKRIAGNSPAAVAGLHDGDRILAIDDYLIPTRQRFDGILQTYPVGSRVRISVLRDGEVKEVLASLVDADTESRPRLGLYFDVDEETSGSLKVARVQAGSPAQNAGIQVGDVVLRFDDQPVSSFIDLATKIGERKVGDVVVIRVRRGDEELAIPVLLQSYDPK